MNGICKAHPTNLSSASQCRALKLTRVQYRSQNGPKFSESGTALCKMCPMPPGWVQDNREKTRPENLRSDAQAMEGEKVKTPHSSRRKEASGAARRGRTADSQSKNGESSTQGFKRKILAVLAI